MSALVSSLRRRDNRLPLTHPNKIQTRTNVHTHRGEKCVVFIQKKKMRENGKGAKLRSCAAETLAVFLKVMKHLLRVRTFFLF